MLIFYQVCWANRRFIVHRNEAEIRAIVYNLRDENRPDLRRPRQPARAGSRAERRPRRGRG